MAPLDVRGRRCPVPILLLTRRIGEIEPGAELEVVSDDPMFPGDVRAWCEHHGHRLLALDEHDGVITARVARRAPRKSFHQ